MISLPSGAGSIEGLGESYEPQLNTGSSTYGVSIALPPGRAGLAPKVRIDYNSFGGNGVCGLGWSLEFLSLKRQADKGFPEYSDGDTYIFQGEELVPLSNAAGDWRCENERGFQRLRRRDFDGDGQLEGWEVTEPDGTRHLLGQHHGSAGRWSAVEHPEKPDSAVFDRTYCWMVDATVDLHGNRVDYEYILGTGMLFPRRISYSVLGQARHEVLFDYEDRLDAFDDYRPSFPSRLDRRLTGIEVRTLGQLVRRYEFSYRYEEGDLLPDATAVVAGHLDLGVSLLKRVVQYDNSGSRANYLPPLIFTYTGLDLNRAEQRSLLAVPDLDLAEPNGRVQLADLNGDGLPDLFATSASGAGTVQRACLNRGEITVPGTLARLEFGPAMVVDPSSPLDLALPDTLVHDPKGKGMVDLSSLTSDGPNKRLDTFANRSRLEVVDEGRLGFDAAQVEATVLENPPAFV
ncbi:MAG: hypothetical protein J0L84_14520, partial [Verrucomicrobia bacterium]|nr:hypothetical protein [Verrucomicrobiota bacterium]